MYGVETTSAKPIFFFAIFFSIILSFWCIHKTYVINPDAICYLQSAATLHNGLSNAMHLCDQAKWPFYSILIYGWSQLSHLSYTNSAFFLNGVFTLLSVCMFLLIVRTFTSSNKILILAACTILTAHEFNTVRNDIIRDHGYWAFYLSSILFFIYFLREKKSTWIYALGWNLSLIIATLFRIEGGVFLITMPWVVFLNRNGFKNIVAFVQLYLPVILLSLSLLLFKILHPAVQFSRLNELLVQFAQAPHAIYQQFQFLSQKLSNNLLSSYARSDANLVLLLMLMNWFVVSVALNVSLIYAFLAVYAWKKNLAPFDFATKITLYGYLLINAVITFIFMIEHMFLSQRYLLAMSLVCMLWVPFALDNIITDRKKFKWRFFLVIFFILFYAVGGVVNFGYSKKYIRDAGDWLAANTSDAAKIYTNDLTVMYYSKHFGNAIFSRSELDKNFQTSLANTKWQQYDYLALRINGKDRNSNFLKQINLNPTEIFRNKRNDEVVIYRVHSER